MAANDGGGCTRRKGKANEARCSRAGGGGAGNANGMQEIAGVVSVSLFPGFSSPADRRGKDSAQRKKSAAAFEEEKGTRGTALSKFSIGAQTSDGVQPSYLFYDARF